MYNITNVCCNSIAILLQKGLDRIIVLTDYDSAPKLTMDFSFRLLISDI